MERSSAKCVLQQINNQKQQNTGTKTMSFLPQNYESPKSSNNYMKLQDGENRIRILSKPILGWEDWQDKKPIRFRLDEKPMKSIDPEKKIKHFWAFIVWNYNENQIQILQITQVGIQRSIENFDKDADWGAPYAYDIKIMRKGEGVNTEYAVNPVPHKPVDPAIEQAFIDRPCKLDALFLNCDPFDKAYDSFDEFMCGSTIAPKAVIEAPKRSKISIAQFNELNKKLDASPAYKAQIKSYLESRGIHDLFDLSLEMYDGILKGSDKANDDKIEHKKTA